MRLAVRMLIVSWCIALLGAWTSLGRAAEPAAKVLHPISSKWTATKIKQPGTAELVPGPHGAGGHARRWLGVSSCTARACHGSLQRDGAHPGIFGNEQTVWVEQDKHARAFAVLFEPRGIAMAESLGLGPAHEAKACLACHAPAAADPGAHPSMLSDGVGCEACHGAAQKWYAPHTSAHWNLLSPQVKERDYGLLNTKQLGSRAKACVQCHVGGPGRDMNHDMIAAGHPRLTFEFATYLSRYPDHWYEKGPNDRRVNRSFEAQAWALGQLAAAQAQLELLAQRADAAAENAPGAVWPEFSEYSCFACHHDLQPASWRQKGYLQRLDVADAAKVKLGAPDWGTWNLALLPTLQVQPGLAPRGLDPMPLEKLREDMSTLGGDPKVAAARAHQAADQMQMWLTAAEGGQYDQAWVEGLLRVLPGIGQQTIGGDWDRAAQLYLAMVALQQSSLDIKGQVGPADLKLSKALGQMRGGLLYPPNADSPATSYNAAESVSRSLSDLQSLLNK